MRLYAALACAFVISTGCLPPGFATVDTSGSGGDGAQGSGGGGTDTGAPQAFTCGCQTPADCGNSTRDSSGAFCLSNGTDTLCAPSCANGPCPDGSTCTSIAAAGGVVLHQCVPATVNCGPSGGGTGGTGTGTGGTGGTTPDPGLEAHRQHCVDQINMYRAQNGVPPYSRDARLDDFAQAGSVELSTDHKPHQHFIDAGNAGTLGAAGFSGGAAENQGSPAGWNVAPEDTQIDEILASMMAEGPGGGHHDNIVSPNYHRVGVGLVEDASGHLYFTNDFSP